MRGAFIVSFTYPDRLKALHAARDLVVRFLGIPQSPTEVLDVPSLPQSPGFPNRLQIALLGTIAGIVFGVAASHLRPVNPATAEAVAKQSPRCLIGEHLRRILISSSYRKDYLRRAAPRHSAAHRAPDSIPGPQSRLRHCTTNPGDFKRGTPRRRRLARIRPTPCTSPSTGRGRPRLRLT